MKKRSLIFICSLLITLISHSQTLNFDLAYQHYPTIPRGILEAVSWSQTRMHNIDNTYQQGCTGMPLPYGVMGVFDEGQDWFIENGETIATISGISVAAQKANVNLQIEAYAAAFEYYYNQNSNLGKEKRLYQTLTDLTHITNEDNVDRYAIDSEIYAILVKLNESAFANEYDFEPQELDLAIAFGNDNYQVLSSPKILIKSTGIETESGIQYVPEGIFNKAIWDPAASCNYSNGRSQTISAVTIHTVQGSYGSCINWFKNCAAQVSAHYVLRSSDGQITQMVAEANTAWHVGSENGYTIGLEHEGYVEQDGWYTTALYNASADLVIDICDRQNISRKRVAYFPWSASTYYNQSGIPGSCAKIKGHMHYPNQSHNDPGVRWDWEYYDNLINSNVPTTTITNISGTIYDSGGASGNYGDDERKRWLIAPPDAAEVTLTFTSFSTENTWDYLYIYDGSSTSAPLIGVYTGTTSPGTVTGTTGKLYLLFKSECATSSTGWAADISTILNEPVDNTPPTTEIMWEDEWKTTDFDVEFIDADETDGSGLEKSFYQVLEYNGFNWTANPNRGFYCDNFDSVEINALWTSPEGDWAINNDLYLEQGDEGNGNTNIYAPLKQDLSNQYLYTWSARISGAGDNRRAGLHFFCDDPTQSDRGNSYFVYFRPDASLPTNAPNKEVQLYKVTNNTLDLVKETSMTINADQVYQYAIRYDRVSGKTAIYVDNEMILNWTDPNPISTGDYISFRSGNCVYEVNNLKVYRSRHANETIYVGPANSNDIRIQNTDPDTPSGRIKSIVVDQAGNLSNIAFEDVNVDWTPPQDMLINDGPSTDLDTVLQPTIEANWGAINDPHSGIVKYKVAIGTTPGGDDVYEWSDEVGLNTTISHALANPIYNQIYFVSVRATNGAGFSSTQSSDGQILIDPDDLGITENQLDKIQIYPNPAVDNIHFTHLSEEMEVKVYDMAGNLIISQKISALNSEIEISQLSAGSYNIVVSDNHKFIIKKLIKK